MILAGDIGGTNTRLALFGHDLRTPVRLEVYESRRHDGLEGLVEAFLSGCRMRIGSAGFCVAGPVVGGCAKGTNLPWDVGARSLAELLGVEVHVINDLEANGRGIAALLPADLATLHEGDPRAFGNIGVISAGTWLGQAYLAWDGYNHHVHASEGGHADFAPRSELEFDLWRFVAAEHGHVS